MAKKKIPTVNMVKEKNIVYPNLPDDVRAALYELRELYPKYKSNTTLLRHVLVDSVGLYHKHQELERNFCEIRTEARRLVNFLSQIDSLQAEKSTFILSLKTMIE